MLIDYLVLFTVKDDASAEGVSGLLSSVRKLGDRVLNVVDFSIGKNFSERSGGYTHGLFVRFQTRDDLQSYLEHSEHRAVVEKLDAFTMGRLVVDYEP